MEDPVDAVFIVSSSEDVGDDEFPSTSDDHGVVTEIGVLEEDSGVFFVDADGVFDGCGLSSAVDEGGTTRSGSQ